MLLTTQLLSAQAPTYVSSPYRYSYSTISHSSKMVDSINRRFVRQPAGKSFHSLPQAVAHYIVLEGNDLEKVKQDMERGIHFDRIMIENHESITELKQHCLVTLSYLLRGKDSVTLLNTPDLAMPTENGIWIRTDPYRFRQSRANTWIFQYIAGYGKTPPIIKAYFLVTPLSTRPLPAQYNRMLHYRVPY